MSGFEKHIFICTHQREGSESQNCCRAKNAELIREYFKGELKKLGLNKKIRANASGCLDHCAYGPVIVVYPEGVWYRVPTLEDAKEILENHLLNNQRVERLIIR